MTRGSAVSGPTHPQFRCRVCKEFVHGTEAGHCPRCGLAAPIVGVLPGPGPRRTLQGAVVLAILVVLLVWVLTRN